MHEEQCHVHMLNCPPGHCRCTCSEVCSEVCSVVLFVWLWIIALKSACWQLLYSRTQQTWPMQMTLQADHSDNNLESSGSVCTSVTELQALVEGYMRRINSTPICTADMWHHWCMCRSELHCWSVTQRTYTHFPRYDTEVVAKALSMYMHTELTQNNSSYNTIPRPRSWYICARGSTINRLL